MPVFPPPPTKYRVAVNPTGEHYGAVASAVVVGREMAEEVVTHYLKHFPLGPKGFVFVDDSPEFGGEHSDRYLTITVQGRGGRWAEPLTCDICMVAGHRTDWRCVTPVGTPPPSADDSQEDG